MHDYNIHLQQAVSTGDGRDDEEPEFEDSDKTPLLHVDDREEANGRTRVPDNRVTTNDDEKTDKDKDKSRATDERETTGLDERGVTGDEKATGHESAECEDKDSSRATGERMQGDDNDDNDNVMTEVDSTSENVQDEEDEEEWETDYDNYEYENTEDYKGGSLPCRWLRFRKHYTPDGRVRKYKKRKVMKGRQGDLAKEIDCLFEV